MSQRYIVCDYDQPFASVHADSAKVAITSACTKVIGHDPKDCTAKPIEAATASASWTTLESWSDLDWLSFGA
jgi:hypothetical protein